MVRAVSSKILLFYTLLPIAVAVLVLLVVHFYDQVHETPVFLARYRFYRTLYVLVAGGVLSVSGSLLQASLRNPLVDHYVLGIGSGALFATYLSVITLGYSPTTAMTAAVCGGLLALALSVGIAERISGSDVSYVLSGISVATLFSGLSLFAYYYAALKYSYAGFMLLGTFIHSRPGLLEYTLIPVAVSSFGYVYLSKRLNTLVLGDEYAAQLGVNPRVTRLISSVVAGVSSSIIVALFGLIGFIGLMSPHISRFALRTSDNRLVIPVAATAGMLLLYVADNLSRYITAPVWGEIPAGSIVSLIGAPFFLALLASRFAGRRT